jgi:hypothetical protein
MSRRPVVGAVVLLAACASSGRGTALPAPEPGGSQKSDPPPELREPDVSPAPDGGQPVRAAVVSPRPFPTRVASVAFDVRVLPPGQAEIVGFVRDRDGNPVGRACVELSAGGSARSPVFTSPQGDFRFTRVPAGQARVTMTVEDLAVADRQRIADYHTHDPNLTVMLRPLVIAPPGRLEFKQIKREGDYGDGLRFIEIAPLALDLQGYSPACRRALQPRRR